MNTGAFSSSRRLQQNMLGLDRNVIVLPSFKKILRSLDKEYCLLHAKVFVHVNLLLFLHLTQTRQMQTNVSNRSKNWTRACRYPEESNLRVSGPSYVYRLLSPHRKENISHCLAHIRTQHICLTSFVCVLMLWKPAMHIMCTHKQHINR